MKYEHIERARSALPKHLDQQGGIRLVARRISGHRG